MLLMGIESPRLPVSMLLLSLGQVHENEVMRAYKTVNDTHIEPISFTVPRRAETFQADIFPPAVGSKPAMRAKEWLDGKTAIPPKLDLESVYEGTEPKEASSDYKPPPQPKPAPVAKSAPKEEPKAAAVTRAPPPSREEQRSSIAAMASKYQETEPQDDEDGDDSSSFEEISRAPVPIRTELTPVSPVKAEPAPAAAPAKASSPAKAPGAATVSPAPPRLASSPSTAAAAAESSSLDQIRQLIEAQTKIISSQNDRIGRLAKEVESLTKKVGSGPQQDQSERIRQLELELEEARS